jgi:predicted nucleotidyltransferase
MNRNNSTNSVARSRESETSYCTADSRMQDPILTELVKRLVSAYQPGRIYLFGSRARHQAGPHSDYDLMVIVPDTASVERKRSRLAYQALRGTGVAADVLVWTSHAFDERVHVPSSLPATVIREGTLLYAA